MEKENNDRNPNSISDAVEMTTLISGSSATGGTLMITGYKVNARWQLLWRVLAVLTLGVSFVVFYWKRDWELRLTHDECELDQAERVLVKDAYDQLFVEKVLARQSETEMHFIHKFATYTWRPKQNTFVELRGYPEDEWTCSSLAACDRGLSADEQAHKRRYFGSNIIDVPIKSIFHLIVHEALNPFYLFQVYAFLVWFIEGYWMYSLATLLMALVSITATVYEIRHSSKALRKKVRTFSHVEVRRGNGCWEEMCSSDLVPGDVINVANTVATRLECDAVLLRGSVVVNESMLTGESVPVAKLAIPVTQEKYSAERHKRHTLFCGTSILQTSGTAVALVTSTGYSTAKGELVRSILFPKPVDFQFYRDSMHIMLLSIALGVITMIYTCINYIRNGAATVDIVLATLDIITFVLPPSLPVCMTMGNVFAQRHLEKKKIFCLSSKYINVSGSIDLVAFDKTGTLTEDGLLMQGVMTTGEESLSTLIANRKHVRCEKMLDAMATCHSLVKLQGKVVGDPLDAIMFEWTDAELLEEEEIDKFRSEFYYEDLRVVSTDHAAVRCGTVNHGIVHQYPFTSNLQRMTAIVQRVGEATLNVHTKGAPETIISLCRPETVPRDLRNTLDRLTNNGYRVIAVASKELTTNVHDQDNISNINRRLIEFDLDFLGLMVLKNSLKSETIPALEELHQANIRTVMVTGDNLLTALQTGRDCCMLSQNDDVIIVRAEYTFNGLEVLYDKQQREQQNSNGEDSDSSRLLGSESSESDNYCFAMDGNTFSLVRTHDKQLLKMLVLKAVVFARMRPELKVQLIEELQELGYTVGMCGDGANDCGALKTAHTGISLSTEEASVASPFTSTNPSIECVPNLIREGRCALVTSFMLFKHLLACSWIYCLGMLILYSKSCNFADPQFFYTDLVTIIYPAFLFGNIAAYTRLSPVAPPRLLMSFIPILSIAVFILQQTILVTVVWLYLHAQIWFEPWTYSVKDYVSYENTYIYLGLCFSFTCSPLVFCRGYPYRKTMFNNKLFTFSMMVIFAVTSMKIINPPQALVSAFELKMSPILDFNVVVFLMCITAFMTSLLFEDVFINKYLHPYIMPKMRVFLGIKKTFEELDEFLVSSKKWPPACNQAPDTCVMVGRTPLITHRSSTLPTGDNSRKRTLSDESRRSYVEVYVTGDSIVKLEDKAEEMMDGMMKEHEEILEDKRVVDDLANSPEFIELRTVSTL